MSEWGARGRAVARALVDVAFGRACVHCGDGVEEGTAFRFVCGRCQRRLHVIAPPACPTCGHPYFGRAGGDRRCVHCEALDPEFGSGRAAMLLAGPGRSLVHALKYRGGLHLRRDVRAILARSPGVADHVAGAVLVPVPLHPRKHRERGYNQAEVIAREAAALAPGAEVGRWLARVRDTATQTRLDRRGREANLHNAFAVRPRAELDPGRRAVLVDDVFTTGATLNACARCLAAAGLGRIDVLTLGHG